ncbi:WD40 repeat domain-containing protein [Nonomuraea solani]|nr:hypothetical protein [Nonomuraea solani]
MTSEPLSVAEFTSRVSHWGHGAGIAAVTSGVLEGRWVVVTGGQDATVRVWDLRSGEPVGGPLTGHTGPVRCVTATVADGRLIVLSGGADGTIRVWDPVSGEQVGKPFTGHTGAVCAVESAVVDGRLLAVSAGIDRSIRVWDMSTGEQTVRPRSDQRAWVRDVAVTTIDGRPCAVAGTRQGHLRIRDLATNRDAGPDLGGPDRVVRYFGDPVDKIVATTAADGRPIAVAGRIHDRITVWDATTGHPVADLPAGGQALAAGIVDGRPIAVTGLARTAKVWNLVTHQQIGSDLSFPHPVTAAAITPAGHLVVCSDQHITVLAAAPAP